MKNMSNYAENRKARFDYEIMDTYECGLSLLGFEVKAVRSGKASLTGAHVIIRGAEAYIIGLVIEPYQPKNTPLDYEPDRTRKLLVTKAEIKKLEKAGETKGLTLIPLSVYNKNGKIKVNVAVARGKKLHDKRESIKKRDTDREIRREVR